MEQQGWRQGGKSSGWPRLEARCRLGWGGLGWEEGTGTLTQTSPPAWLGALPSSCFLARVKPSKIIIILLASPTDLPLHGASTHGLGAPEERGRQEGGLWGFLSHRGRGTE